jgi:ankyrin repeat protein
MKFEGLSALGGSKYETALQAVAWSGNLESVKLLITNGADLNAQGKNFLQSLVHVAHWHSLKGTKSRTALQSASHEGHQDIVKQLLEIGSEIDTQSGGSLDWDEIQLTWHCKVAGTAQHSKQRRSREIRKS